MKRADKVTYDLKLPSKISSVQPVIHVSILKKCIGDPESILHIERLGVKDNIYNQKVPIEIFDRQVNMLTNEEVSPVKVLWKNNLDEGETW